MTAKEVKSWRRPAPRTRPTDACSLHVKPAPTFQGLTDALQSFVINQPLDVVGSSYNKQTDMVLFHHRVTSAISRSPIEMQTKVDILTSLEQPKTLVCVFPLPSSPTETDLLSSAH